MTMMQRVLWSDEDGRDELLFDILGNATEVFRFATRELDTYSQM